MSIISGNKKIEDIFSDLSFEYVDSYYKDYDDDEVFMRIPASFVKTYDLCAQIDHEWCYKKKDIIHNDSKKIMCNANHIIVIPLSVLNQEGWFQCVLSANVMEYIMLVRLCTITAMEGNNPIEAFDNAMRK